MMLYRILLCRNGLAGLFLWRQDNNREASNKELFANLGVFVEQRFSDKINQIEFLANFYL